MPYIKKQDRDKFANLTADINKLDIASTDELNYLVTILTHRYLNQKPESYSTYNDVIGVLESAKLELYRRHVTVHENEKIRENGDV